MAQANSIHMPAGINAELSLLAEALTLWRRMNADQQDQAMRYMSAFQKGGVQ